MARTAIQPDHCVSTVPWDCALEFKCYAVRCVYTRAGAIVYTIIVCIDDGSVFFVGSAKCGEDGDLARSLCEYSTLRSYAVTVYTVNT